MSAEDFIIYRAAIFDPQPDRSLRFYRNGALVADSSGRIHLCGDAERALEGFPHARIQEFGHSLIIPGLVDTHVHLPQYQAIGQGNGELLDWLDEHIFPLERQFASTLFAREQSLLFFHELLAHGTTAAAIYCSSHEKATDIAFDTAARSGIRACMGKSIMELNAPEDLVFSSEQNIADTLSLAGKWHNYDNGRLRYVVTPRFAGSCSHGLMQKCAELARAEGLAVQTHLAENPSELKLMKELFPEAGSYTGIYERAGLLSERTILAHCIYLSDAEKEMIRSNNCSIAHCPGSNRFLQSGIFPLRKNLDEKLRIGLGSDIAGGYNLSMLHEAREAIESSKSWNIMHRDDERERLSPEEALWLASLGGANILGLDSVCGNFDKGKEADFVVLNIESFQPQRAISRDEKNLLRQLIYGSSRNSVTHTFIRGKLVYGGFAKQ